jgi:hypothetical protein
LCFCGGAVERLKRVFLEVVVCTTMSCDTVEQVALVDTVDRVEQVDIVNQVNLINLVNCITREGRTPLSGNCFCQRGKYP